MISALPGEIKNRGVIFGLFLLLLPVLILLPGLSGFPYPNSLAEYSDITVSHYPVAHYIRYAISNWHSIPLWSPDILSGYPLIADPLSGLLYPPGWLALIMPLPLGFNLSVLLHLLWGGAGMYFLCRAEGLEIKAALFAALAFEAMPKLFAHFGAGHITLIYAVTWTPWLLYVANRNRKIYLQKRDLLNLGWEGVILGVIFLADPRWFVYAGLLWLSYYLVIITTPKDGITSILNKFPRLIVQTIIAGLIAAPLALPLLEYSRLSTRANLQPEDVMSLSLPLEKLFGLIFPDLGGFHEWVFYPGALIIVLCVLTILHTSWRRGAGFWLLIAFFSLLVSLGENLPFGSMLARIPGLDLMRVPPRSLFLFGISMVVIAARGLDNLIEQREFPNIRIAKMVLFMLTGFAVLLTIGTYVLIQSLPLNFVWGSVLLLVSSLVVGWLIGNNNELAFKGDQHEVIVFAFVVTLLLVDLGMVDLTLFKARPAEEVFAERDEIVNFLTEEPGKFRIFSPSYSLPQSPAARARLQLADGVHPLQLASYANFMVKASGIPEHGYSVTLPPYSTGSPSTDNIEYSPDAGLLGLLNVRYVVAEYSLSSEGLDKIMQIEDTSVYKNLHSAGPAWVMPDSEPGINNEDQARIISWKPNQVIIEAVGPGNLVLSEVFYPGWTVLLDGETRNIEPAYDILRSVRIGEGVHRVIFYFRPVSFYIGLGMAIIGLVLVNIGRAKFIKRDVHE